MAISTNGTKLTNLVNPQVMAALIDTKKTDYIKLAPLAVVDATLEGRPGNTISLPSYAYIGDATDVAEGADMPIAKLTASTVNKTVKKAGRAVELSDEAILSGYGDPRGEAADQLALAIASKVDADCLAELETATLAYTTTGTEFTADDIADALVKFGEDIEGEKVILVSPATYAAIRKTDDWCPASEIAASMLVRGTVGMIHGCQVVVSNKLSGTTYGKKAYIVKPGALRIFMKRDVMIETDRDIIAGTNIVAANQHFLAYLYDSSKAVKLTHA